MAYSMLHKSELKITRIKLDNTNLHRIADCVAELYGVARDKVLVIDVRNDEVCLDILDDNLDPHCFMAREKELLARIAEIPGVTLGPRAKVTSDGMLGWIAFEASPEEVEKSLEATEQIANDAMEAIAKRIIVFPTGTEVLNGEIEDTNTPMLLEALREAGFEADAGEILKDDLNDYVTHFVQAIYSGYGTIITTGGVGAEDKDHSVEAIEDLDAGAATPYIVKFQQGHGRHHKDGVRIGVGQSEHVRMIALPGPNDEVRLCLPVLLCGLKEHTSKEKLAANLADVLRNHLRSHTHPGN
nr:molybdopterin-binding protein [uncultured Oscillibacter sp.]